MRGRARITRDTVASSSGAFVFSLSLAVASVALPLLALRAGYSAAGVGLLTAASALAQLAVRAGLGIAMRRLPDWTLVTSAALLLAMSNGLVVVSTAVAPFVIAELLQGVARACFWTGAQTHVVRGPGRAVGALATVNLVSTIGMLSGPVLAGLLTERAPQLALAVAAGVALVGVVPTLFLDRLPPFRPPAERPPGRIWRRAGVDSGCWAGVTVGAWRGLLQSYVPVALHAAHQAPSTIGILVTVANGTALVGSGLVARVRTESSATLFAVATVAAGLGTAAIGLTAGNAVAAGLALALSGVAAGSLQTIGPAVAAEAVHPEERGEAIAAAGAFRAAALFGAPLGMAGALGVTTLSPALLGAGLLIALPAAAARRMRPSRLTAGSVSAEQGPGPPA
ncbi:MAG: MFS transporter [Carbonactinosporaceae bacterium]